MNVYDFDKTIYSGDSTVDFWLYCLREKPVLLRELPGAVKAGLYFRMGLCSREAFKERFYRFLPHISALEDWVCRFWDTHLERIVPWYLEKRRPGDLVISASPEFLVRPACERLGLRCIASRVDPATGRLLGPNCRGGEKARRFAREYPGEAVESFFSDSLSDAPMAELAAAAYLVRKGRLTPWPEKELPYGEGSVQQ